MTGLLQNLTRYGHNPRILIRDGTSDPKLAEDNREAVRKILNEYSFDVRLADTEDTRVIANRFVKTGLDRDVVEFALQGISGLGLSSVGANRNLHLLATAGEAFLSMDDDTDCKFTCAPGFQRNLETRPGGIPFEEDPAEIWVHPDRQSLLSSSPPVEIDFIRSHQELLGRDTALLVSAVKIEAGAQSTSEDLLPFSKSTGKILVTLNGLFGDCAWGTPSHYLFINRPSFEHD